MLGKKSNDKLTQKKGFKRKYIRDALSETFPYKGRKNNEID